MVGSLDNMFDLFIEIQVINCCIKGNRAKPRVKASVYLAFTIF